MKMQKSELAAKLNKVKGIVPKRTTMPVLQGVLVKGGYFIANNMEMTVKTKIGGMEDECFIIPERAFDLINNLPDGEVTIEAADNMLTIKADKIKNTYQTADPALFPETTIGSDENEITIKADVFMEAMRRVAYAIPAIGANPTMTSMLLQARDGQINFVGLDGHVLAWDRVGYDGEFEMKIPKSTVEKMKTLGLTGDIHIRRGEKGAVFATDDFEVYTRLVDGTYFRYRDVFKEMPMHTVISRTDFLNAMVRAKMCTDTMRPVIFELRGNQLSLNIKDTVTDYHETIDLQEELSGELVIGFDAKLVLESLKAFDCDNVGLSFGGAKLPMIIEAEDSDFKTLVLPVSIG